MLEAHRASVRHCFLSETSMNAEKKLQLIGGNVSSVMLFRTKISNTYLPSRYEKPRKYAIIDQVLFQLTPSYQ